MNYSYGILAAFIFCGIIVRIRSTEGSKSKYFQVTTDRAEVEKLAVTCAENEVSTTVQGLVLAFAQKLVKNICNCSRDVKIAFCEEIVRPQSHGMEFDLDDYAEPKCEPEFFWLISSADGEPKYGTVEMFACPTMVYTDLRTETRVSLRFEHLYYVSKGVERDSALIFFQPRSHSGWYALQYVRNIAFDALEKREKTGIDSQSSLQIELNVVTAVVEQRILDYLRNKRIMAPYRKFRRNMVSLNICGHRQPHKIYICRKTLRKLLGNVEFDTDNVEICERHRIHFLRKIEENFRSDNNLALLQCPPVRFQDAVTHLKYPLLFYLSSNAVPASVTIFSKFNTKGERLTYESIADNVDTFRIAKDVLRSKFMRYQSNREQKDALVKRERDYNSLVNDLNTVRGPVQMPTTIAEDTSYAWENWSDVTRKPRMTRDGWIIDDLVMQFSKIKTNKLVYQRFRELHRSLNVCQLAAMQRRELCYQCLSISGYKSDINLSNECNYPCIRVEIALTTQHAIELNSSNVWVWKCQQSASHPDHVYYIGKSHLKDAVFVYRLYNSERIKLTSNDIVYPDALVGKINRSALADAPLLANVTPAVQQVSSQ